MALRLLKFARITGSTGWPLCAESASGSMGQEGVNVRRLLSISIGAAMTFVALASPAQATDITFGGSSGTLAATAHFVTSGTTLTLTLTNTGSASVDPASVLANVLFNCSGCGTLTAVSAITSGATVENGVQISPSGSPVGGEWALIQSGTSFQVASSGANGAGASDPRFPPGTNLEGPPSGEVDGIQYGIANSIAANANTGVTGVAITLHDVVFTLTCSQNCGSATFSNVVFQYGTAANEPSFGGTGSSDQGGQNLVPEPTSLLLFGSGLAMTAYRARRKNRQQKKDS